MQKSYVTDKSSIIDSLPLFSGLPYPQKKLVESICQIVECKKGESIYEENAPPDYFYCVVSGRVEIYHPPDKMRRRQEQSIECVRRGDYFGSISSLTGKPHTVSARALNDALLLRISAEDFERALQRIPQLAVFLSRSLSRRLSKKAVKEIFASKIISVYSPGSTQDSLSYAQAFAENLRKESGKKVIVIMSRSIPDRKRVSPQLSLFTEDYHYVIVSVQPRLDKVNFEILKQSDVCHIISPSDRDSLRKVASLTKRLERSFGKYAGQDAYLVLKEDQFYSRTSYGKKVKILSRDIDASLPEKRADYKNTLRRIARETSGVMVGLALGSGAAIGLAHIGVLKVLEKEEIPIDVLSGSSIGALIGTLWAAGVPASEIEELACSFRSKLRALFLIDPTFPIRGLIKGRAVRKVLEPYLGKKTFFDVKLPLKIVACDIRRRREIVIDTGRLIDAVMASVAIPGVFEPVIYKGTQLVDGGIVNPVPVNVLSRSGIKRIIAVNVLPAPEDAESASPKRLNIYSVIVNSFQATEYTMAAHSCQQADVSLHPVPKAADWHEFYKAKLFIKTGAAEARRMLPEITRLVRQKQ